jgi:uncharacterized membrane protein
MRGTKRINRNRFNKGFNKENNSEQGKGLVFPSPSLLESYEEISPGLADNFAELLKQEQKHRHVLERRALKLSIISNITGQAFGLLLSFVILYVAYALAANNEIYLALAVSFSGFGFLACSALASVRSRRQPRNFHPYRHRMRNKPEENKTNN